MDMSVFKSIPLIMFPVIFALTVPIGAQAFLAYRFGERDVEIMRRKTFDPLLHLDWLGTLLFPLLCIVVGSPIFLDGPNP